MLVSQKLKIVLWAKFYSARLKCGDDSDDIPAESLNQISILQEENENNGDYNYDYDYNNNSYDDVDDEFPFFAVENPQRIE